jgi:hypothetical protein
VTGIGRIAADLYLPTYFHQRLRESHRRQFISMSGHISGIWE